MRMICLPEREATHDEAIEDEDVEGYEDEEII